MPCHIDRLISGNMRKFRLCIIMIVQNILLTANSFRFHISDKSILTAHFTPGSDGIQNSHQITFFDFGKDRALDAAFLPDLCILFHRLISHIIPLIRNHDASRICIYFIVNIRVFLHKRHGQIHFSIPHQGDHMIRCLR